MPSLRSLLRDVVPPAGRVRLLAVSNLSKTAAHGVIMSISILYFTRSVGLPATQVGLALTLGAAVGMLAGVPAGRLADALGPRRTTVTLLVVLGAVTCGYALVGSFWSLVAVTTLVLAAESAANAARGALIAGLIPPPERVRAWSFMRSTANLGVSAGTVAGGVALLVDTPAVYVGLLVGAGALFATSGLAFLRVPRVDPVPADGSGGPRWVVLRDKQYATVALLNAVLVTNSGILVVALPVWISQYTSAPPVLYSVILLVNTITVILFQVRAGRGSEEVPGGARALRRAGIALAACCAMFALAAGRPPWLAAAILLAGAIAHVLGEMLHSAGSWSLGYGLAVPRAQGQYQGMFEMSSQLGSTIAPLAMTTLVAGLGAPGWLVLATFLLAAGLLAPLVARWALASRPPGPASGTSAEPPTPAAPPDSPAAASLPTETT